MSHMGDRYQTLTPQLAQIQGLVRQYTRKYLHCICMPHSCIYAAVFKTPILTLDRTLKSFNFIQNIHKKYLHLKHTHGPNFQISRSIVLYTPLECRSTNTYLFYLDGYGAHISISLEVMIHTYLLIKNLLQ